MKKLETRANLCINLMDPVLNKQTEKIPISFFLVFIALVRELLDRTVYISVDPVFVKFYAEDF
jgi:hypothetical protein